MQETVTLLTDRTGFTPAWRSALERHGFAVRVCSPDELGLVAERDAALILDAAAEAYDEDELLAAVGFARATGAVPYVAVESAGTVEDVVEEICEGRVCRGTSDVERVASTLSRRMDQERARRFEFVTVAPRGNDVLAILGNGHSVLVKRPVNGEDDRSDIVGIVMSDDALRASLELESGKQLEIHAASFATDGMQGPAIPIDGSRLGARLRELRLEAGLTQAELARRTGIHRPNIARVEAGRHTPSLETLSRLAGAIGVSTTRVLSEN